MSQEIRIAEIESRLSDLQVTQESSSLISVGTLTPNPTPERSRMLMKTMQLYTKDITDPTNPIIIDELFQVTPGNFSPVRLPNSGGNRWVLAFGASGYGIKFHFPYGTNKNKIYITFCERNTRYVDGWMDYLSTVTTDWVSAAVSYFNRVPANSSLTDTSRDYTASVFNRYNQYNLWANFQGLGPSSVAEGSQGSIKFTMKFVTEQATVETGGAISAVTTRIVNPSTSISSALSQLNTLTQTR